MYKTNFCSHTPVQHGSEPLPLSSYCLPLPFSPSPGSGCGNDPIASGPRSDQNEAPSHAGRGRRPPGRRDDRRPPPP